MTRRVFVAVDTPSLEQACHWVTTLAPHAAGIKLGLEFFMAQGVAGIRHIAALSSAPLFLDVKLHDIPNTVAGAVRALVPLGVRYITLHTLGGETMLRAAVEAASEAAHQHNVPPPTLLGVTVLTSMDADELQGIGQATPPADYAITLARLGQQAGLRGFVASAAEVARLRNVLSKQATLITPGIRPENGCADDQKRTATPAAALTAGADYLVIGRPITHAPDPVAALCAINESLSGV